jgi:Transposase IS4
MYMNSKAARQGYKIYSLCCSNGYMVDFRFTSKQEKVAEIGPWSSWTTSEAVVLDLATSLLVRFPRPRPFYVLHIDNFFTNQRLYQELYKQGIRANGTAKAGSGIPKELCYLRDTLRKQNDHGAWYNYVVESVNCIAFCDMASNSMMTTVHDPTVEEYTYFDRIKRPGASLRNVKHVNGPNGEELWLLRKLYALHDYNQHMGGSDSHAQQNSYYSTAKHYHARNWLPLLYLLIDAAITNSYILYKEGVSGKKLSHVEFQTEIAFALLRGSDAILRQRLPRHPTGCIDLHTKSVQKDALQGHSRGELPIQRRCEVCSPGKPHGRPRKALQELSNNVPHSVEQSVQKPHRTIHCCKQCRVPVCYNSRCWGRHVEGS